MLRDRGTIKWTAMMLPEHVKLLRDWVREDFFQEKPELDEQKLEQLNEQLIDSHEKLCTFRFYTNKQAHTVTGRVKKVDAFKRTIQIIKEEGGEIE